MDYNQLASLALFQTIYNKESDIYKTIAYFIKSCLYHKNTLPLSDLREELELRFGCEFPIAVLQTVLNKNKDSIHLNNGLYSLNQSAQYNDNIAHEETINEKFIYNEILDRIIKYISEKDNINTNEIDENLVLINLCDYLLKKNNNILYYKHIASFIYENKDEKIQSFLQTIMDGGLIISGLQYQNDTNEIYNLSKDLVFYLDMEWLFSAYGYNDEFFKRIFMEDFIPLVKEINQNKKGKIKLRVLPQTMESITQFFNKAEDVLKNREHRSNNAMRMILDGCNHVTDVITKKHQFIKFLRDNVIKEDENAIQLDLTNESDHKYNLDNLESRGRFSKTLEKDLDENFHILNTINKLRTINRIYKNSSLENSGFVFITATNSLNNLSKDIKIRDKYNTPLSLDLGFIINRLWFKLQKPVISNSRPISLNILVNARITLNSIINDNLNYAYNKLLEKCQNGSLSKDVATEIIAELRTKIRGDTDDHYNDLSSLIFFNDVIEKSILEISEKNNKLRILEEDNKKKTEIISDLEKEKYDIINQNKIKDERLEYYQSKERKKAETKQKIIRYLKRVFLCSIIMTFIYIFLIYIYKPYENIFATLSVLITIIFPFVNLEKK